MTCFFPILNASGGTLLSRSRTAPAAPVVDEVLQAWPARVACPDGAMPGSALTRPAGVPVAGAAVCHHLQLDGVRQQYRDVLCYRCRAIPHPGGGLR